MTQQSLFDDENFDEGDHAHQNAVAQSSNPRNPLGIRPFTAANHLARVRQIRRAMETGNWNDRRINKDATETPNES